MHQKQKNQMDLGGCHLLIFCFNLKEFLLTKYFLKIGKYTQLKVSGLQKLMVVVAQFLFKKAMKQNKHLNMSISNLKVMINGSTILNLGSK
mgnify:FL=1